MATLSYRSYSKDIAIKPTDLSRKYWSYGSGFNNYDAADVNDLNTRDVNDLNTRDVNALNTRDVDSRGVSDLNSPDVDRAKRGHEHVHLKMVLKDEIKKLISNTLDERVDELVDQVKTLTIDSDDKVIVTYKIEFSGQNIQRLMTADELTDDLFEI